MIAPHFCPSSRCRQHRRRRRRLGLFSFLLLCVRIKLPPAQTIQFISYILFFSLSLSLPAIEPTALNSKSPTEVWTCNQCYSLCSVVAQNFVYFAPMLVLIALPQNDNNRNIRKRMLHKYIILRKFHFMFSTSSASNACVAHIHTHIFHELCVRVWARVLILFYHFA